jgi:LacI family transcriptional regulator
MAEKMGYRPNTLAAGLRSNKTNTIGVIISWIDRPFISSLIGGIEEAANEADYNVIITQSNDSYEKEVANANTLYNSRVGGLVVSLAMETEEYQHFYQFIDKGIPVVFVDRVTRQLNTDRVGIDNHSAAFKATEHLIQQGCQRIAHLAGSQIRDIYRGRKEGYLAALKQYQIPIHEELITYSGLSQEEGRSQMEQLLALKQPPDGLFAANDTAAVGAIQYAKQYGLRIPQDLAIVGFNNDPVSTIIDPPLTTIDHPARELGRIAAEQVLKKKENKEIIASQTIELKTELLIRQSSLKIPERNLSFG